VKKLTLYLFLFTFLNLTKGQNTVLSRVSPENNKLIQIKWYSPKIINPDGFNIYRKGVGSDSWIKLNSTPIKYKTYKIPEEEFKKDKELKSYVDLASSADNLVDLALLATVIKSFKNDAFSKYLGIRFDDTTFEAGKEYEYKITFVSGTTENDLGISKKITATDYAPIPPPKNINTKNGNKKVSFKWDPEPNSYFGVNIYRKSGDTGTYRLVTKDPIILSKAKNAKGEESYGDEFYVDGKLHPHTNYYFQLEALDFFGSPSTLSAPILVHLKDLNPPKSPDSLYYSLDGKKVFVKWKKKIKESDLLGYNIYRTNKNDSDFTKINKEVVPFSDSLFLDQVPRFSSYMYVVSCIDKDSNETVSNPFHIKVYDNEPPSTPKNLTIQADSGKLTLRWNKSPEDDIKGYLIYRTINKNTEDTYVKMTPTPLEETIFIDSLPKNIKNKFLYKVVAVDLSLNRSPYSDFAIARMPDVTPPSAPFIKTIYSNDKNQILIEWLPNAEPDLQGYSIYRKNTNDSLSNFKKLNVKYIDRTSYRYTDRYVEENIVYEYYLQAVDSSGNVSQNSNRNKFKSFVNDDGVKTKITQFEVNYSAKRKQVALKWKLKSTEDLLGYVVYKQKPGETIFSPISGTLEDENLLDTDVSSGSEYVYQLRVYNQRGDVYKSDKIKLSVK
jgi:uncharacterized protein